MTRDHRKVETRRELSYGLLSLADLFFCRRRAQPPRQDGFAAARARGRQQLEEAAGAKDVQVVCVQMFGIAKAVARAARALPTALQSIEATFVERGCPSRAIAAVQNGPVIESERDKDQEGNDEPRYACLPKNSNERNANKEQREACPGETRVNGLAFRDVRAAPIEPLAIDFAYGRILPSAFHK